MSEQLERTKYLRDLRREMIERFDQEELKILSFDLSVEWDDLHGETKKTKVQALIMHLARRGRLENLVTLLHEERPDANWSQPPSANQQVEDESLVTPNPLIDYLDKMATTSNAPHSIAVAKGKIFTNEILSKLRDKGTKEQWLMVITYIAEAGLSADLRPNFSGFDLSGANLREANLRGADLSGADLSEADLGLANLSEADLISANLSEADLRGANLHEAFLFRANLREADLREADLIAANLGLADLHGAFLCEADLRGADLFAADLSETLLREADLRTADLREAVLALANLNEADMRGTDLREANLIRTLYTNNTRWPEDFDPIAAGAINIDAETP